MRTLAALISAAALCVSTTTTVSADSPRLEPEDYLNLLRIDLRATKAQVLADSMELTTEESRAFWPIYGEYDAEVSRLNARRISLLREFAQNYATIDDEKAALLSQRTFEFMQRRLDLLQKYSRKVTKATSPVVAARFAQIENHLQMLVDVQLASEFPLVPRRADLAQAGVR
jgi:hypothetical protein